MIFNEIYGAYYGTVTKIINAILENGAIDKKQLQEIITENAFEDSYLEISQAIKEDRWPFITKELTTTLKNKPTLPLTTLQLRWLRSLVDDKRIRLFLDEIPYQLWNYEPLFSLSDIEIYDKYDDCDDYENQFYISVFRKILKAIKENSGLKLSITTRKDTQMTAIVVPLRLEYSEKDDKFRLIAKGYNSKMQVFNLSSITSCELCYASSFVNPSAKVKTKTLVLEVFDKRNALERVMLHFAHFKKQAEKVSDDRYIIRLEYDEKDETELVIRVLSFGPTIRAVASRDFVSQIKKRLETQRQLFKNLH